MVLGSIVRRVKAHRTVDGDATMGAEPDDSLREAAEDRHFSREKTITEADQKSLGGAVMSELPGRAGRPGQAGPIFEWLTR